MNRFDQQYDIRLAKLADIPMIMKFIDEHWRKGHIMAVDKELFNYEFVYKDNVNFVLAIDKNKNSLEGLFGFLNASYPENTEKKDIWGSFWKVKEGNLPLLGIEIAKRVSILTECRMELGVGLNVKTAVPLRKKVFKDYVEKMKHYYQLNPKVEDFKIAKVENATSRSFIEKHNVEIEKFADARDLDKLEQAVYENNTPYKDQWYLIKRYFNHPYYNYEVYGIKDAQQKFNALLVGREVTYDGQKILRIVDYVGEENLIQYIGSFLEKIMIDHHYEYIDFYALGIKDDYLKNAGFSLKDESDVNIIPNYFEPFVQVNVDLWVNYPKEYTNVRFFKADADQDRPNFIKNTEA